MNEILCYYLAIGSQVPDLSICESQFGVKLTRQVKLVLPRYPATYLHRNVTYNLPYPKSLIDTLEYMNVSHANRSLQRVRLANKQLMISYL